jgi:hypothetical protein
MTLSSTANRVQYSGDGSTTSFAVTFVFWDDSDVVVVHTDSSGTETTWTKGTQYTLTGGDGSTGTVTVDTSPTDYTPAAGETLTIYSGRSNTQTLSLPSGGALPSSSVEQALDQLTRLVQQLSSELDRKISYPVTEASSTSATLPTKDTRASNLLGFDGDGEPEAVDPASVGSLSTTVSTYAATLLDDSSAQNARATLELNTSSITELTIASGSVTVTGPIHTVDTEGDAASDDLDTLVIAGERLSGDFMVLLAAASTRQVNITTDGNFGAACTLSATVPTVFMLVSSTWWPVSTLPQANSLIANGCFRVADEAASMTAATTPANNDDTYFNHCLLLSDGNDIADLSQETSVVPTGAYAALKVDIETANKRMAIGFPIEARDFAALAGGKASVQFKIRTETATKIENVRAYFLSWASTADSITSDVISAWGSEGADPTFATNWTAENTAENFAVPEGAYGTVKIEGIDVDTASAVNGMLVILIDDTDAAVGDLLYIADVCVEAGAICHAFPRISFEDEAARCRRRYRVIENANGALRWTGYAGAGSEEHTLPISFDSPMASAPTMSLTGTWSVTNCGQPTAVNPQSHGLYLQVTSSAGGRIEVQATTGCKLTADSRL